MFKLFLALILSFFAIRTFAAAPCDSRTNLNSQTLAVGSALVSNSYDACNPRPGSSTAFEWTAEQNPTGLPVSYTLNTLGNGKFEIVLNPNFLELDSDPIGDLLSKPDWAGRTKQCLAAAKGRWLGPDGQTLSIRLATEAEKTTFPRFNVNIKNFGDRSDSENWLASIDCETIYHELLHKMGLVDEYEEKLIGSGHVDKISHKEAVAWDCRKTFGDVSIMADHTKLKHKRMPLTKGPSLLKPRHFNAIVYPGCNAKNLLYYQVAKNAYLTSEKHGGSGCVDVDFIGAALNL